MEALIAELLAQTRDYASGLIAGLVIFFLFWLGSAIVDRALRRMMARSEAAKQDVLRLLGQATKAGLLVFGAITALGTMGINVSALVAGLGLTGFALGFALRDALSNLLAGLLILIYRPFQRHHRISVAGFEGTVVDIDLRYTTLQQENKKYLIPNATLFTNPITLWESESQSVDVPLGARPGSLP